MKRLKFRYSLKIEFDTPITQHSFTVRCTVPSDERQKVLCQNISILPKEFLCENTDSFGNVYFFGKAQEEHDLFEVVTEGTVLTGMSAGTKADEEYRLGMFVGQTHYTSPDSKLKEFFKTLESADCKELSPENRKYSEGKLNLQKSLIIMEMLRKEFNYVPGVTDISTTASAAWQLRQGVCQDYAHIMLSLCRMAGIPCRYVAGMLIGEGLSHAWVEIEDGGMWYGLDPTNGTIVSEEHIKISHGRDYEDCLINQGVFTGTAGQKQTVYVSVEEENEAL
ncbi:MAG: transglutaminase family protein [Bacteroides sp.]